MKGYLAKCPNLVESPHLIGNPSQRIICGYAGYEVLVRGVWTRESGFDPLAMRVRCRRCDNEYYLFPQVNFKEGTQQNAKEAK